MPVTKYDESHFPGKLAAAIGVIDFLRGADTGARVGFANVKRGTDFFTGLTVGVFFSGLTTSDLTSFLCWACCAVVIFLAVRSHNRLKLFIMTHVAFEGGACRLMRG